MPSFSLHLSEVSPIAAWFGIEQTSPTKLPISIAAWFGVEAAEPNKVADPE